MTGTVFKDPKPRRDADRRQGAPKTPLFGELLAEAGWEPEGAPAAAHEGWVRARGLVPERRHRKDRRF